MPAPGEHKTVQSRIHAYAQEIDWTYVPRALFRTLLHQLMTAQLRVDGLALEGILEQAVQETKLA